MSAVKLNDVQITYLKQLTEENRFFTGERIGEDYSHDELGGV